MGIAVPVRACVGVALASMLSLVAACQAPAEPPAAPPDYAAEYGPSVDAIFEAYNTKAYDKLDSVLSENYKRVAPDQNADGVEAAKAFLRQVHTAYPDFKLTSDQRGYGPGVAFVEWTASGTDSGEGGSGNPISVTGTTKYLFANGRITNEDVYFDSAELMRQLGREAIPHAQQ